MHRILFVTPTLDFGNSAKQLTLLVPALRNAGFEPQVCSLGGPTPWANKLAEQGIPVTSLNWQRAVDIRPLMGLRELIRSTAPELIHVWDTPALRAVMMMRPGRGFRVIASGRLLARSNWVDRRLLRFVAAVTTGSNWEAEQLRGVGLTVQPLAPVATAAPLMFPNTVRERLGLSQAAQILVGVGPLTQEKGFHDAIWALDILHFLHPDLHLVLVGEGPDCERLRRFAHTTRMNERVHFVGRQEDVAPWLAAANVVWVPSRSPCGVNVALEAMAQGRPVVASRWPELHDIVVEGETGLLSRPEDRAGLARQTRILLEDLSLAARMGRAGRERVLARHSTEGSADRLRLLYRRAG